MPKTYKSDEGYYQNADGSRDDVTFHDEILDDPMASARAARAAVEDAIASGMDPVTAESLYGIQPREQVN